MKERCLKRVYRAPKATNRRRKKQKQRPQVAFLPLDVFSHTTSGCRASSLFEGIARAGTVARSIVQMRRRSVGQHHELCNLEPFFVVQFTIAPGADYLSIFGGADRARNWLDGRTKKRLSLSRLFLVLDRLRFPVNHS